MHSTPKRLPGGLPGASQSPPVGSTPPPHPPSRPVPIVPSPLGIPFPPPPDTLPSVQTSSHPSIPSFHGSDATSFGRQPNSLSGFVGPDEPLDAGIAIAKSRRETTRKNVLRNRSVSNKFPVKILVRFVLYGLNTLFKTIHPTVYLLDLSLAFVTPGNVTTRTDGQCKSASVHNCSGDKQYE